MCVRKSLMTVLTFLPNKSHTFSPKAFIPSREKQSLSDSTTPLSGTCPQHFLTMWLPPAAFWLDTQRRRRWREEGAEWVAGSGHMSENKFLPHCHGDESTAGRGGGREGRGLWGTGWPAVVNNSSPYPAPKWLGKHRVLWSQKGPEGLREGHHPRVTRWQGTHWLVEGRPAESRSKG